MTSSTRPQAVRLTRDCAATRIPDGERVLLPEGTLFQVQQALGGTYTILTDGGLFRIAGKDGDALGLERTESEPAAASSGEVQGASVDAAHVWDALRCCYDPEIPVNIVDLGLVYDLRIEPLSSGKSRVTVQMTLTAPGCGMGGTIAADAEERIRQIPGVEDASVQLVWEPPWHPSRISPEGRAALNLE